MNKSMKSRKSISRNSKLSNPFVDNQDNVINTSWWTSTDNIELPSNDKQEDDFKKWKLEHQYPNFVPKDWIECYKMPLHLDRCYAWTEEGEMALSNFNYDFNNYEESIDYYKKIINIINGDINTDFEPEWKVSEKNPCVILYKNEFQFLVRGWGHLTGCGHAYKLPRELASNIQDQFINYILNRLNGTE